MDGENLIAMDQRENIEDEDEILDRIARGEDVPETKAKPLSKGDMKEIQDGVLPASDKIVDVKDPGFWDIVKGTFKNLDAMWNDPTGENGAFEYLAKNMASGIGTAAGKVAGGFVKGAADLATFGAAGVARAGETVFNALTNSNWHGVSDAIAKGGKAIDEAVDAITPDIFALRGMYDGIEGAKEVTGALGEFAGGVAGLGGIGAVGKVMKGAAMAKKGMDAAKAGKLAHAATGAGFGLGSYERMASDPNGVAANREGGFWSGGNWLQEGAALAGGMIEGAIFGAFGPLRKSMEGAKELQPFMEETRLQILKRFAKETVKSGAAMAGADAGKQGAMLYAGAAAGTPWLDEEGRAVTLESAAKSVASQFAVGSAFHVAGAMGKYSGWRKWRKAVKKQGEIEAGPSEKMLAAMSYRVEQNRKAYCPMMDAQARTAAALVANGRTVQAGGVGCEYVEQVLAGGEVKFTDGSVWRPGRPYTLVTAGGEKVMKEGRATITVSDGTILDAQTGALAGYAPKGTEWRAPAEAAYMRGRRSEGETDADARKRLWELGGNDQAWYMEKPEDVALAEENNFDKNATGELSAEGTAWLEITQMAHSPQTADAAAAAMADVNAGRKTLVEAHRDLVTAAAEARRPRTDGKVRIAPEGVVEATNEGRAENAGMFLDALERGELPVDRECETKGLGSSADYQETHELEGEWDQSKAQPVIVWIGVDGQRECVAGKSRLEAARKAGAKTIDAVYVKESEGWQRRAAKSLDAVQNLREGKGTAEQIFRGIDALGARSPEDLARLGIMTGDMPAVLDALDFANFAAEPVKAAVREGKMDAATAGAIVQGLGAHRTGRASARLQQIAAEKIAGKMPPEEAMGAIEELRMKNEEWRMKGERWEPTEKEIEDAIIAGRKKAAGETAVEADTVQVETETGELKSLAEVKENGDLKVENGELKGSGGSTGNISEGPTAAAELDVVDGAVGCARFPGAKVGRREVAYVTESGETAKRTLAVIEGISAEEMMAPENRADAVEFLKKIAEAAGEDGYTFADRDAGRAAEMLLRGEAMKAAREAAGAAEKGLVDAGQRLVDGLFGKESGIKVREGTQEEAEAAIANGELPGEAEEGRRFSVKSMNELGTQAQNAAKELAEGRDATIRNGYGEISYGIGKTGRMKPNGKIKGGLGLMHIVYARMAKDGATLEEAIDVALRVGDAIENGQEVAVRGNKHYYRKGDVEAIFAINPDTHKPVLTGYKIGAVESDGAIPASSELRTVPLPRKEDVVAALKERIANLSERVNTETKISGKALKDAAGQVKGWFDRGTGEVVLFKGADVRTVAHEIGWHAVRMWAEKNSPQLLAKMNEYAASCPKSLRRLIEKRYKGFTGDALVDEIGAGRFERELGDEFRKLLETRPQVRSWWRKVCDAIRQMLKGWGGKGNGIDLKKIEKMAPEEAMSWMAERMLEGKGLPGAEAGRQDGGKRASIGGIFTGTAADYANESRQGGKDDGPSLQKIGTGEGSQVYGWGLYGSTVRGVAEGYAMSNGGKFGKTRWLKNGEKPKTQAEIIATEWLGPATGNPEKAIKLIKDRMETVKALGLDEKPYLDAIKDLREHGDDYSISGTHLYEQTFFTDRAPGDESHLLKWYEPVTSEQKQWIADELNKSIDDAKMKWVVTENGLTRNNPYAIEEKFKTGKEAYQFATIQAAVLAKSKNGREYPKLASEFLARAGIDGVKYPVDSYGGKGVKDGDKAGWNYVSFRDDNIRVDHKWTDGQRRYSIATRAYNPEAQVKVVDGTVEPEFENLTTAEIRNYIRDRYIGREVTIESDGTVVVFTDEGLKSTMKKRGKHRRTLHALDTLVKSSHYTRFEENDGKDKHAKLVGQFVYTAALRLEDGVYGVELKLDIPKSDPDKTRFKGQTLKTKIADAVLSAQMRPEGRLTPASTDEASAAETIRLGDIATATQSISQRGAEGKGEIRPSIGGEEFLDGVAQDRYETPKNADDLERLRRKRRDGGRERNAQDDAEDRRRSAEIALGRLMHGKLQAIEPLNPGAEEQGAAAKNAAADVEAGILDPDRSPSNDPSRTYPIAMGMSELVRMYRAMSGGAMPKVLVKRLRGERHGRWRNGKTWLAADVFGIVDKSDMAAIREELKKEGKFRHEDPQWVMRHSRRQVEEMRDLSEVMLEERMAALADDRAHGKRLGGGRSAINAMAHEIGRLACEMPIDGAAPKRLKDMQTLGRGVTDELAKDPSLKQEAEAAVKWWRGEDGGKETGAKRGDKEIFADVYGMFLASPMELERIAPRTYGKIRDMLGANEKLWATYRSILQTRATTEGPARAVLAEIQRQWDARAENELKELKGELDRPMGGWWQRTKERFLLDFHSTEGPAMYQASAKVAERRKELKRQLKAGVIEKGTYDAIVGEMDREIDDFRMAILMKQRGGGEGRLYASEIISKVLGDVKRDGVTLDQLRSYMKCRRTIELQGRADSAGFTGRDAVRELDRMKEEMGESGFLKLEAAAKRFQAVREQHVLNNQLVVEAFGQRMVDYWRMNASYVRSERIWSAEEVAAYKAAREAWMKEHPGETNVLAEIEAIMDMHMAKSGGTHGETFLKRLEGSFKMTEDPLRATIENDLRIQEFVRKNHYAVQLAKAAKALELEGYKVVKDVGSGALRGSKRYGTVAFMENGERKLLVMPKVVAEGFAAAAKDVNCLIRLNRWISSVYTQLSPRFAVRNIMRNREANNNNVAWMREGGVVTAAGLAGMRPVARWATFLMEQAAAHLPDRVARNGLMNLLYGEKTNMYWVAEATRMAKLMMDPVKLRERADEASRLAEAGRLTEAQQLMEEIATLKRYMKLPVFAGVRQMIENTAGRSNLDELFGTLGFDTKFDGEAPTGLRRVKRWMKRRADAVRNYNTFEEARTKIIALLAADRANMRAAAEGREVRGQKEIAYTVATMSGSPRYENRGRAMNYLEVALGPFMNVGMKGAWRTVESMRKDPGAWWGKAAGRIAGRLSTAVLWMGGGYKILADAWRAANKDDEKENAAADALERFGRRMSHALANCSDYRLRNYDIVPVGLFGRWSTFGIAMPRGDEDRLLMPAVDMLAKTLVDSKTAERCGFSKYTDMNYSLGEAAWNTTFGSGLVPDMNRTGTVWNLFRDVVGAWFQNPYNSFTQRTVYSQQDFDARWTDPMNFLKKIGKQAWSDLGGGTVLPSSSWDEDEGEWSDQGTWAMGFSRPDDAGAMPVGGKTIFQALHRIPWLSAVASGVLFMANDGNKRIARRIERLRQDGMKSERYVIDKVANEVVRGLAAKGDNWDYSDYVAEQIGKYRLPEDTDREVIEGRVWAKVENIRDGMGMEADPIGKVINRMGEDRRFDQIMRHLESIGWDEEE